jgi:tRNA A-37 threonylcarbamoyl transferase component Bud32
MSDDLLAGRYILDKELGRGGMGIVYRAHDVRLKRTVALKMLPRELTNKSDLRRRLAQEALAAAPLNHSGIATVYEFEENAGESFIVFEYIEGATLRTQMKQPGLATESILNIGIQIADALAAAHRRGIVHRDLKPENIMLKDESGSTSRIKILDFGLAKLLQPIASTAITIQGPSQSTVVNSAVGLLIGTVNYMSPEQLEGEPADARSDIYALGLMLYEMATGINPFIGKTPSITIANILKQEPPLISAYNPASPAELGRIARKCIQKCAADRYQSARELADDLGKLRQKMSLGNVGPGAAALEREAPAPPLVISRALARGLLVFIQAGYLVMYGALFFNFQGVTNLHGRFEFQYLVPLVILSSLCGLAIRLYLISALGFDYTDLGRQYRRLFPAALLVDAAWAAAPTLLLPKMGGLALVCVAGLAYLPFSQRTLVYAAYSPLGGRASKEKAMD